MMATQSLQNLIDPPPRLTGDPAHDTVAVIQWLNAFYVKGILSGGLLQPQNMDQSLISLGALVGSADMLAYYTAEDTFDLTGFTAFSRTLLDDVDADEARTTLGAGDVDGPGSSTNNHVAVFDGTTGKLLKDGGAPAGDVVGPAGAIDGNVALFDTNTGKLIKDGGALGTAAFADSVDFDASGAAAAAQAASQPVDAELTAIAGLASAANKIIRFIGSGTAELIDFTDWTTPAFDAANFTGNGAMTWTVEAGDVGTYAYAILGKIMFVNFYLSTTSVGGTPNTTLYVKIPGSKTAAKAANFFLYYLDNGTRGVGAGVVAAGGTTINCIKPDVSNWTAAANTTYLRLSATFEIQ